MSMQEPVTDPERVLSFWLGKLDAAGLASPEVSARWWSKDSAFDARVRAEFASTWDAVMRGEHEAWLEDPRSRLAYVIVLDQLSRNMYRGAPEAFAGDARALRVAREGIALGHDLRLRGEERVFLYMPLMHAESLAEQEECIALFTRFRDASTGALRERLDSNLRFAVQHRDIIALWGRFPHRNTVLNRASTAAELAFLTQPGSSF